MLEIPDIFGGRAVDAGPEYTYEEKMTVPSPLGIQLLSFDSKSSKELYCCYSTWHA